MTDDRDTIYNIERGLIDPPERESEDEEQERLDAAEEKAERDADERYDERGF